MRNIGLLEHYVADLHRQGFRVGHTPDFAQVVVYDLPLPGDRGRWTDGDGRPVTTTSVSLSIPWDFPNVAPGVGLAHPLHAIHVPLLRLLGRATVDHHPCQHAPWAWLCFQHLDWNPAEATLATLLNTVTLSLFKRAGYFA